MLATMTHEAPAGNGTTSAMNTGVNEQELAALQLKVSAANSEAAVKNHLKDALKAYYSRLQSMGQLASLVVAFGAKWLGEHKPSNTKVSELVRECSIAGEPTPIRRVIEPGQGKGKATHSYVSQKAGSHPYRQDGKVWSDLFKIEAHLSHGAPIPEKWPTAWPATVTVGGVAFSSPVRALQAGNGLRRVHIAYMNEIKPAVIDLTGLKPWQTKGQILAGLKVSENVRIVGRFFNKTSTASPTGGRYEKKSIKASDSPHGAYGIVLGLLAASREGMTEKMRQDISDAAAKGTYPKDVPLPSKADDNAAGLDEAAE